MDAQARLAPHAAPPTPAHAPPAMARSSGGLELDRLCRHVQVIRRRLARRQHLYRAGQPFRSVFLVHAGFLKVVQPDHAGPDHVTGFRMRGELVGVESIGMPAHGCDAVALESSEVWELAFPAVLDACVRIGELQARLTAALADEIRRDRAWMLAFATRTADQRLAMFLLDLAARHAELGFSPHRFMLRMRKLDIASFLAVKPETVSRVLAALTGAGLIAIERREVRILDAQGLRARAGMDPRHH
jgi:CRP/FNR family transcriptional regulator